MIRTYSVEQDWLSRDYDDRMMAESTSYDSLLEAVMAYNKAIQEKCIDDETVNARCSLDIYYWKDEHSWALGSETLIKNY